MAKILYKEGFEGQNELECIEGIEIDLFTGYKVLVYPKYKELPMLSAKKWRTFEFTEFQALKVINSKILTDEFFEVGSPAAKFVRKFKSEKYGEFNLPTLLAAGEIAEQLKLIDALAETIEGADLLRDYSDIWSCCCGPSNGAWFAMTYDSVFDNYDLCSELTVVPVVIYKNE